MTEDTSPLYVYVKDWARHQPRSDRPGLPWIRMETAFLGNDAWLGLSAPDRCLLICIWLLTQRYGNGRLLADERWLKSQAKAHKSSLDRLVQAGFLTLSTTKAALNGGLEERSTTYSLEEKENARAATAEAAARAENGKPVKTKAEMAAIIAKATEEGFIDA